MLPVEFLIDSHVAVITLARSDEGNRLNPELLSRLQSALDNSMADADVRAIVIRSSGSVFSHGMDFQGVLESAGQKTSFDRNTAEMKDIEAAVEQYARVLTTIHEGPKPVICVVSGEVKAGGVGLVCSCDVVFATTDASFELSEVLFGLIPANVLPYLLTVRISLQKTRYLILTSKKINAEEAFRLNLVDEVIPRERLEPELKRLMKRLLRSSPSALAETKKFTRELHGNDIDSIKAKGMEKLIELIAGGEALGAIRSFQEGSTPEWFDKYNPENPLFPKEAP